jgi:chromosome segregation ATPase
MASEITDEIKDLQSNVALSLLNDMKAKDAISAETAEVFRTKFVKLHDLIVQSFQNHKFLYQRTKKLKSDMFAEKNKYDTAYNAQAANQEILEELNHILQKSQNELDNAGHRHQILEYELGDAEREKIERQSKIIEEEKDTKKKYEPTIEKLNIEIKELKEENGRRDQQIDGENRRLIEMYEKIEELKKANDKLLEDKTITHDNLMKVKDEPKRLNKNSDMLFNAHAQMQKDLDDLKEELAKKDKILSEQASEIEKARGRYKEHDAVVDVKKRELNELIDYTNGLQDEITYIKEKHAEMQEEKVRYDVELKALFREIRRHTDNINTLKKEIDTFKKEYKYEENVINKLKNDLAELDIAKRKHTKTSANQDFEIKKQLEIEDDMKKDTKLLEWKRKLISDDTLVKEDKTKKLKREIVDLEKQIAELQAIEGNAQKTVKNLTALRESMARKASAALLEVRETREELKIKELLILDLTKKQQEIEFKLNSFKTLYEEVKSARNKYVNLIQNSTQDLAELKEKIKIVQNELEILKNESAEKDRTLMEYKHILQAEVHKRDKRHAKLNKLEYVRKQKKEVVDQQINEIEKQNMIILSLEKEMLNLRHQYEVACESRNYTGIQLIDRNDELCILYEKANIQENILRNGERDIQALEDDIRMIRIEMDEVKRKIEVSRKDIPIVPKLADEIIQLKNELNLEKDKERRLADELENPNNKDRWRDLGGDDPDQEALEAKIQVLEERLNNKKENLLEKELILDEITNLSEKLRGQALEGRQSSLELSEKVNDFQVRLKELTRKMMATISELSMFQATSLKLQQEKDGLEHVVEEAVERIQQGLPPAPETEVEYQKMVRDKDRYQQEREIRIQRDAFEKSMPPFAVKTTAMPRVQQYVPVGGMGLPKPYGSNAPFRPSDVGTNIRHIKKPNPRDIEI